MSSDAGWQSGQNDVDGAAGCGQTAQAVCHPLDDIPPLKIGEFLGDLVKLRPISGQLDH
jgi:hypothetical protein